MRKIVLIISLAVTLLAVLCGLVLFGIRECIPRELYEYKSADEWGADDYTHIVAFINSDENFDYGSTVMAESAILDAYKVDTVDASSALFAASAEVSVNLVNGRRSSNAAATVYSGDYFAFYKPKLKEGAYPEDTGVRTDAILIDELAAWQLFGTNDNVVGMSVEYSGYDYVVCGVAKKPEGIYLDVYGDAPRVYMSANSIAFRNRSISFIEFDAMLPNPITGFAENTVSKCVGAVETVVNNDTRFRGAELKKFKSGINEMIVESNGLEYPFTEKAALLLAIKASTFNSAMNVTVYAALISTVVALGAVWGPTLRFIGKIFKKLKF